MVTGQGDGVVVRRFHLAIRVDDLAAARRFYGELLGCAEGRSAATWVDFDLHGHQLVAHLDSGHDTGLDTRVDVGRSGRADATMRNRVDGDDVPVPHFGVILDVDEWNRLAARLVDAGVEFVIEPHTRFAGQAGEQSTMFLLDPAGNAIEFKAFADDDAVFAREPPTAER
jgi:hypothetical protein